MARATLRDVAQKAGVSASTVSRVFSRPEMVAADVRDRVEEIARELRYIPNPIARGLARQRTGNLGVIVPDIANPYFTPLVKSLQSDARARGCNVFVADTDEHASRERDLGLALSQQVDGIVLASPRMGDDEVRALAADVPLITIGRLVDGVSGVGTPADNGIRQAVELLAAQGHRRIAYLDGPPQSFVAAQRRGATLGAAEEFGCSVEVFGPFQTVVNAGRRAADLVLASDVTAVIAYNDQIAFGCMARLKECGRRVPEDYSIIGIDDSSVAEYCDPRLTTVRVPIVQAGALGLDILWGLMNSPRDRTPIVQELEADLVVRRSTAAR